jgi:broad specificity phosphatase PhoE
LSDLGRRQAQAIARELAEAAGRGQAIENVFTSPLKAAAETALFIGNALGYGLPQVEDTLSTLTPEILPEDGGIESLTALQERAWGLIERIRDENDLSLNFVLVSHELTIRAIICRALSMSLADLRRYQLDPGSVSSIEFRRAPNGDMRQTVGSINETCHLDESTA